jgi:hypothetical protein
MTAAEIIQAAKADGVDVALSPGGSINATGEQAVVNRWQPTLKEHKPEIINLLTRQQGGADTAQLIPDWCDSRCDCFHLLEVTCLEMAQGCYQETDTTHWRWSRLDKMKSCPLGKASSVNISAITGDGYGEVQKR